MMLYWSVFGLKNRDKSRREVAHASRCSSSTGMRDHAREDHDADREDQRDHAGGVDLERDERGVAAVHAARRTRFAWWTGMRRWPSLIRTMPTIVSRPMSDEHDRADDIARDRVAGDELTSTALGNDATMPPKMMIEMPLPMPNSVISSPIQTSSIVPAVIVSRIARVGRIVSDSRTAEAFDQRPSVRTGLLREQQRLTVALQERQRTVSQWVYWLILLRPRWPSFDSSFRRGMIGVISCMMIDAVMYG